MVQSTYRFDNKAPKNSHTANKNGLIQNGKVASLGKVSLNIIHKLHNPVDAVNRFINLALQHTEEDSQSRQFLLESKSGMRKMSVLLKRLNHTAQKLENELQKTIAEENE
jgi:C4-dicarboxylate-specific signal transduction histidine kinase